jgi:hypothetical protein
MMASDCIPHQVLAAPGRSTFDALAHTRASLHRLTHEGQRMTHEGAQDRSRVESRVVITWAAYLEHKLRELAQSPGTPLTTGLIDSVGASSLL